MYMKTPNRIHIIPFYELLIFCLIPMGHTNQKLTYR